MDKVRVRIAPSPTGEDLHIGNVYTALINYVFAKKNNGKFIIRIEDTDRNRLVPKSEERILSSLRWLGLTYDEGPDIGGSYGPYRQSERLPLYKKYAEDLVKKGAAYYCFCPSERLAKLREHQQKAGRPTMYDGHCRNFKFPWPASQGRQISNFKFKKYVIRLKVPKSGETSFKDLIRGEIKFKNELIDDQIILKSDGYPTYHLGVVVDDYLMKISHVIRAEEWISSVPKHILLFKAFGWELPQFAHLPLLRNPDHSKLSKRKNPVWLSWYREQGFLPEAILNYLGTMSWSMPNGKEIFTIKEMIKNFSLADIKTTAPVFDLKKLEWMDGEYLRKDQRSKIKYQISNFYNGRYPEDIIEKTIPLIQTRIKKLKDYETLAGFFFERPKEYEKDFNREWIKKAVTILETLEWKHDVMEERIRELAEDLKVKPADLFMTLRLAIAGKTISPPLFESLEILGKEETLTRLLLAAKMKLHRLTVRLS